MDLPDVRDLHRMTDTFFTELADAYYSFVERYESDIFTNGPALPLKLNYHYYAVFF
jgi:hypothetical protein